MKGGTGRILLAALLTLGACVAAVPPGTSGAAIVRFQQVAPGLYRGGQPTAAGFEFLKWRGIKTVINLRGENEEELLVKRLGMNYVHLPLRAGERVPDSAIQAFLAAVRNPGNQPVFVHCLRGADRTGAMIAFYRITDQGWNGHTAYQEARALGMRWWYWRLRRQLFEFKPPSPRVDASPAEISPVPQRFGGLGWKIASEKGRGNTARCDTIPVGTLCVTKMKLT